MSINQNTPVGLVPRKHGNGGTPNRTNRYYIAGGLNANIYRGSAVVPTGTSKQITAAAAAAKIIGVFHGCNFVDATNSVQFRPFWGANQAIAANTAVEADVIDDPTMIFSIQVSGAGLVLANVGKLADLVIGTGTPATGNSGDMLDQTTISTGTTFRIEELDSTTANNFGQYAKALVRPAIHYLAGGTLT